MTLSHTSTLTRKGQATIPVELREKIGLHEGDRLVWWEEDGEIRMMGARAYVERMREYFESLRDPDSEPLTIEEIKALRAETWTHRYERFLANQ
jgi:AbrB family looped-hinge helix DNA binding protein